MGGFGGDVELVKCNFCGFSCIFSCSDKKVGDSRNNCKLKEVDTASTSKKVVVLLKMDLHCVKCASKARNTARRFSSVGVEEVKDNGEMEMIVVGNVNPEQLRAKVEEKAKTKVKLLSVSPAGDTAIDRSTSSNISSSKAVTAVLRTQLYCESCVRKCKKFIRNHEGVQDVIIEKEHGTTYAITVTGAVDVDHLLRHVQSKLGRKVEAVTSPSKSAQSPPSQQAKKIDCEEVSDGKAAKGKEKVED